jgi:hypothetical protein
MFAVPAISAASMNEPPMERRSMRIMSCMRVIAATACAGGSAGTANPATGSADERADVARARAATAPFRALDAAVKAGYSASVPSCLAHPEHGAMGFHHVNPTLLDDELEIERPEILVYERMPDGSYAFNGIEYVVPYSARPREAEPPTIMDQKLKRADGPQLWYLHVWLWKENGEGLFADWNPAVVCR